MSKNQQSDPAKVGNASPRDNPAEDVVHNDAEEKVSREALAGEAIADAQAPEERKAAALRQLPDADLLALAKRAGEAEHWLDLARRNQADFENTRKRLERESSEVARYVVGTFAKELLVTVDNLERALAVAERTPDFKGLYEGIKLTYSSMLAAFEKSGLRPIDAQGKPFDPAEHEALMLTKDDKLENNAVAQVFERGWKIHDRVLRPAKVVVNQK